MEELDVKQLRKNLGLSQSELADILGVHYRTVQNWETGTPIPKTKYTMLCKLMNGETPTITAKATNNSTAKVNIDNSVKTVADIPPDVALLKAQIDSLTEQINLLKAELQRMRDEKDKYWEMIDRLTKK